jgi:hypothetical protein
MNEQARNYLINQYLFESRERDRKEPVCSNCGHGVRYHNKNLRCPDYTGPFVQWLETKFVINQEE